MIITAATVAGGIFKFHLKFIIAVPFVGILMVTVRASRWLALDRGSRSPVEGLAGADGACARVLAVGVVDGLHPLVADAAEPLAHMG